MGLVALGSKSLASASPDEALMRLKAPPGSRGLTTAIAERWAGRVHFQRIGPHE